MFLITGCITALTGGTGPISIIPIINDTENAAEIFIIREKRFIGSMAGYRITLDHKDFCWIRNGEYLQFYVEAGDHIFEVKQPFDQIYPLSSYFISCRQKEEYYFFVSPSGKIVKLKEEEGLELMKKSKPVLKER